MTYNNILDPIKCKDCKNSAYCFLRKSPMQKYPESTQDFFVFLLNNAFYFNPAKNRWHADFQKILDSIIADYDSQRNFIQENRKSFLSIDAQRDSDKQLIRNMFKQFIDVAAKATEKSAPADSIAFDGVGLVLASDYLEAVHKTLSMFKKYNEITNTDNSVCGQFSQTFTGTL